jgi:hypothetical protein
LSRIFISHSSANNAPALAVAKWLADAGWAEYFLDITPSRGLAPGERWQEALKSAADRCEAVLFLISPAWQASRWCLAEFLLAKQIGKTIFGVLVEATPLDALPREMTAEWQLCDLVTGTARQSFRVSQEPIVPETEVSFAEDGLMRLRIGLQRAGLDPASFAWPPPSDPNRAPYRGLKALEPEDAAIFFGRESAIVRGLDALRGSRERGVERLFVILGASGAGKSSYLRAGLWPRLVRDDTRFLPLPVIRPERAVMSGATGLAASLETAFRERRAARSRAVINQTLQESGGFERLLIELQALATSRIDPDASPPMVAISIDQGEELFGAEGGAEAERFLDLLGQTLSPPAGEGAEALAARQRALVILGIRSDSYERLQTEPRLAQVVPYLFSLPPIARAEFKAVVEGPARRHTEAGHKLTVDPALTERLVDETEGADALPLLAFTLERLFVEHGGDGKLLLEDYEVLGGVRGSIEAAIEAAFAEPGREPIVPADKAARERLLRAGFIPWLARVDPDTEERKRRVARWEEIPPEARPLLERLIEQRLLVRDRRKLEGREDVVVVEVAHEALLRQWPTLTAWLDEDAASLKILGAVQRAAGEWVKNRGEESAGEAWLVHTGERLIAAEALRQRPDFDRLLGADGQAYLDACRARDDRLRKEKEERAEAERIAKERELEQAKALAEEQRRRADEQTAASVRQRRLRNRVLVLWMLSMLTAMYASYNYMKVKDQAITAEAVNLWHPLASSDREAPNWRDALLRLAKADSDLRSAFVREMLSNRTLAHAFSRESLTITRALVVESKDRRELILDDLRAAPSAATETEIKTARALLIAWLGAGESSDEATEVLVEAMQRSPVSTSADSDFALGGLAQALGAVPGKLTPEQAVSVGGRVVKAIERSRGAPSQRSADSEFALGVLAQGVAALAGRLPPDQAKSVARSILREMQQTVNPYAIGALNRALAALARKMEPEEVANVAKFVITTMQRATYYDDFNELGALGEGFAVLAGTLPPEQARRVEGDVVEAMKATENRYAQDALKQGQAALVGRAALEQAASAAEGVGEALQGTKDSDQLRPPGQGLAALTGKLTPEQAAIQVGKVVQAMWQTDALMAQNDLAEALASLASQVNSSDDGYALLIFGVLKYPWTPVEPLGRAMRQRFLDAPDPNEGFWALISWGQKKFKNKVDFSGSPQEPAEIMIAVQKALPRTQ